MTAPQNVSAHQVRSISGSVFQNDDDSPFLFKGFSTVYTYMDAEFAVKGCDGMSLIHRGGDTTKWSVVYRFACAYHNYVSCPFIIRIRIVVCNQKVLHRLILVPDI